MPRVEPLRKNLSGFLEKAGGSAANGYHTDCAVPEPAESSRAPSDTPASKSGMDFTPYFQTPRYTLDTVILPAETRRKIDLVLAEITYQNLIFDEWGMAETHKLDKALSVNLAGPPGTGKTLTAEALAAALGRRILIVPYQQLESKFVGETPKNIAAVFDFASRHNAVLFFDEADSFLGKRLENVTQSTDTAVNLTRSVMLLQLTQYEGVVVFATNLMRNYDPAFVSRIRWKVQFELPDEAARRRIWEIQIPDKVPKDTTSLDFGELAARFDKFSGRDIKTAVFQAVVRAACEDIPNDQKCVTQQHFIAAATDIEAEIQAAERKDMMLTPVEGDVELPVAGPVEDINQPMPEINLAAGQKPQHHQPGTREADRCHDDDDDDY